MAKTKEKRKMAKKKEFRKEFRKIKRARGILDTIDKSALNKVLLKTKLQPDNINIILEDVFDHNIKELLSALVNNLIDCNSMHYSISFKRGSLMQHRSIIPNS